MIKGTCAGLVRTVFFDAAGTLFRIKGSVGEVYGRHAGRFGYVHDDSTCTLLDHSFREAFQRRPVVSFARDGEDLVAREREWWRDLVKATFRPLDRPFPRFEEFFESLYRLFGTARPYSLEPGCRSLLTRLRENGIRLGVISNFDSRLDRLLEGLDIRHFFESVTVPSRAGHAKPEVQIFRQALESLQASAPASAHVGDHVKEDFEGARGAGMRAVLYDPANRHLDLPVTRIRRLHELPSFLV